MLFVSDDIQQRRPVALGTPGYIYVAPIQECDALPSQTECDLPNASWNWTPPFHTYVLAVNQREPAVSAKADAASSPSSWLAAIGTANR